jgi:hypothetical protein
MVQKILTLTFLVSCYSLPTLAAESSKSAPWIFTTTLPTKTEVISIPKKEFCRPISTDALSDKCVQYKQGIVCPQDGSSKFVISTYENKKACEKALKKTKRLFAQNPKIVYE